MQPLAGTSLTDQALTQGEVLATHWRVKAEYAWDTGRAVGRFMAGLKQGQILGIKCPECNRILIPPRAFCELCYRPIDQWVPLSDTGVINTFSVSFVNWDATRRESPEVPAVIEIDGAGPGMGILHVLGEVGEDLSSVLNKVKIGKKVQAVWKPPQEREGSILDIRYFRLIE